MFLKVAQFDELDWAAIFHFAIRQYSNFSPTNFNCFVGIVIILDDLILIRYSLGFFALLYFFNHFCYDVCVLLL